MLLLAAGFSRRFGADKTLQCLPDGQTLALASLQRILSVTQQVSVVLRPEQQQLRALLAAQSLHLIETNEAEKGLGASLAAGVAATQDAAGWLVALADMPWIFPSSYQQVLAALSEGPPSLICAPAYRGQRGHPVGFGRDWLAALQHLSGDTGARSLLLHYPECVQLLPCDDPGVLQDIDHPQDLLLRTEEA